MALKAGQIIEALCPELAGSPSLPVFLEMAGEQTSRGFFGGLYPYAVAYKALHLYETSAIGKEGEAADIDNIGGGAAVASMSEGGLSVSFAQNAAVAVSSTADLGGTKWGRMLLDLTKSRPTMGVNTAGVLGRDYRRRFIDEV
jgi:hypothetical protein